MIYENPANRERRMELLHIADLLFHLADALDTVRLRQRHDDYVVRHHQSVEDAHVDVGRIVDDAYIVAICHFGQGILEEDVLTLFLFAQDLEIRFQKPHVGRDEVDVWHTRVLDNIARLCSIHQDIGQRPFRLVRTKPTRRIALLVVVDKEDAQLPGF